MPGGPEDLAGVGDADGVVRRRVHHQQGPTQRPDALAQVGLPHVLEEVPTQRQRLAADQEGRLALGHDPLDQGVVVVLDVAGLERGGHTGHRLDPVDQVRRGDPRGPTEGVPHQQPDVASGLLQETDGLGGVVDLVGEGAVAPVALGVPQPEVVEAQHADPLAGQLLADPAGGRGVLAEGEPVGEDPPAPDPALRVVDQTGESGAAGAREPHAFCHGAHGGRSDAVGATGETLVTLTGSGGGPPCR